MAGISLSDTLTVIIGGSAAGLVSELTKASTATTKYITVEQQQAIQDQKYIALQAQKQAALEKFPGWSTPPAPLIRGAAAYAQAACLRVHTAVLSELSGRVAPVRSGDDPWERIASELEGNSAMAPDWGQAEEALAKDPVAWPEGG